MSRTYVAKTEHKRPCDLCGDVVLPGDRVVMWAYVGEDGPGPGSNIIRCHATCSAIQHREELDEWTLGRAFYRDVFEYGLVGLDDPKRWEPTKLVTEAAEALAAARAATTTEG